MRFILLLSLPLYALDQITKWFVLRHVHPEELHVVVPDFFSLVHVTNTGAAFGSFRNNNLFFIVLSCVALGSGQALENMPKLKGVLTSMY